MADRRWWILNGLTTHGAMYIDAGAWQALQGKSSLFAAGIRYVEGTFHAQQAVQLRLILPAVGPAAASVASSSRISVDSSSSSAAGDEVHVLTATPAHWVDVGRGISNYSCQECMRIAGRRSQDIASILGYVESEFIMHRDNIVLQPPRAGI
jgi:glutamate 5-kinase